ncbi:hypothetical protein D3C79_139850 [compost metagenome]
MGDRTPATFHEQRSLAERIGPRGAIRSSFWVTRANNKATGITMTKAKNGEL